MSKTKQKMDPRCPRQLTSMPRTFCPMAVQRLKVLRNAGRELSEAEESSCPGCPWAIDFQMANYCFFQYMAEFGDKTLSDIEIATMNNISVETVKKIEKTALNKIKEDPTFTTIKENNDGEAIVPDFNSEEDFKIFK